MQVHLLKTLFLLLFSTVFYAGHNGKPIANTMCCLRLPSYLCLERTNVWPGSKNTYLLFEKDGKPFVEEGLSVAVCTSDDTTAPRHVKWVREIEIRRIE